MPMGLSKPEKIVRRGTSALNATGTMARAQVTNIAALHRPDRNRPSGKIHPTAPSPTIIGIQSHSCSHAAYRAPGGRPPSWISAQRAYSVVTPITPPSRPTAQKIHPIGLDGRRSARTTPSPPTTSAKAIA
jgi:hypothetical protein